MIKLKKKIKNIYFVLRFSGIIYKKQQTDIGNCLKKKYLVYQHL